MHEYVLLIQASKADFQPVDFTFQNQSNVYDTWHFTTLPGHLPTWMDSSVLIIITSIVN